MNNKGKLGSFFLPDKRFPFIIVGNGIIPLVDETKFAEAMKSDCQPVKFSFIINNRMTF